MDDKSRRFFWETLCKLDGQNTENDDKQLQNAVQYPPFIYRFRPVSVDSLEDLRCNRLLFSSANYFDDPFDSHLHIDFKRIENDILAFYNDKEIFNTSLQKFAEIIGISKNEITNLFMGLGIKAAKNSSILALRKIRDEIQKELLTICFTESGLNETLWLKYAQNHRGFALEYDPANNDNFLCGKSLKCEKCSMNDRTFPLYPICYSDEKYDATIFARAVATHKLVFQMAPRKSFEIEKELGVQAWEREKISLIKKRCHEYDKEWRIIYSCATNSRLNICWRPSGVLVGLRCPQADRNLIIEMAKIAGIPKVFECFINDNDELDKSLICYNGIS